MRVTTKKNMVNNIPSNPLFTLHPGQKKGIINYLRSNGDKDYAELAKYISSNLKVEVTEDQLARFWIDYLSS